MTVHKILIGCVFLFSGLISCGRNENAVAKTAQCETSVSQVGQVITNNVEINVINSVYSKFVFADEAIGNDNPKNYFTDNALKKLHDEYEYDCEDDSCYAYYALRTSEQDSKPDSEDISQVCSVESIGDGWYVVSYLDMGWPGKTRVKIVEGKIDDYQRFISE